MTKRELFTKDDWAWLAGFLDARGMLALSRGRPRLVLRHQDFDVLEKVGRMLDVPVRGPFQDQHSGRKESVSPHWIIQITAYGMLWHLYENVKPFLSAHRLNDFAEVLGEYTPKRPKTRLEFAVDNCGHFPAPIPSQSGYRTHLKKGELPCRVCAESSRLYDRQYKERSA